MIPRLFIDEPLVTASAVALSKAQAHYLKAVLRRELGAELRLFNGRDGEFQGEIISLEKQGGAVQIIAQTRRIEGESDLALAFAPVKRGALEMIVQKATEMGVTRIEPVNTVRTNVTRLNLERLSAIALEAAEQSERLTLPPIMPMESLDKFLQEFPPTRCLIYCDEAGDDPDLPWGGPDGRAAPILEMLRGVGTSAITVLIGPEGGFTAEERVAIRALNSAIPVNLGPRILRADTAAIAALTMVQAVCGDWHRGALEKK